MSEKYNLHVFDFVNGSTVFNFGDKSEGGSMILNSLYIKKDVGTAN